MNDIMYTQNRSREEIIIIKKGLSTSTSPVFSLTWAFIASPRIVGFFCAAKISRNKAKSIFLLDIGR